MIRSWPEDCVCGIFTQMKRYREMEYREDIVSRQFIKVPQRTCWTLAVILGKDVSLSGLCREELWRVICEKNLSRVSVH